VFQAVDVEEESQTEVDVESTAAVVVVQELSDTEFHWLDES
jgi:hypothetical protein